jgi:hypothetical protein
MPMMDVLIQVTAANGITAGGMLLKVPIDRPPGYLHYKPNMPIGKLGCTTVEVVSKAAVCDRPRKHMPKVANLPFEVREVVYCCMYGILFIYYYYLPPSTKDTFELFILVLLSYFGDHAL